jgi:hypothetical protein
MTFYARSGESTYHRFMFPRMDMPNKRLQEFVGADYANSMMILAIAEGDSRETIASIGQYDVNKKMHTSEAALVVTDEYQIWA